MMISNNEKNLLVSIVYTNIFQPCKGWPTGADLLCDTSVGGDDEDRGHVWLEGSIKEGKTLNVQHVYLINKQNLKETE